MKNYIKENTKKDNDIKERINILKVNDPIVLSEDKVKSDLFKSIKTFNKISKKTDYQKLVNDSQNQFYAHINDELNNIEEEGNMSEEIKEEEISKNNADENINNKKNKTNKLYKSQIEFNHNILSLKNFDNQSMTTKNKKVYKPRVNQFDYLKKIKKEQQKLYESKSKPKLEIDNYQSLEDSFRHRKIGSKRNFRRRKKNQTK